MHRPKWLKAVLGLFSKKSKFKSTSHHTKPSSPKGVSSKSKHSKGSKSYLKATSPSRRQQNSRYTSYSDDAEDIVRSGIDSYNRGQSKHKITDDKLKKQIIEIVAPKLDSVGGLNDSTFRSKLSIAVADALRTDKVVNKSNLGKISVGINALSIKASEEIGKRKQARGRSAGR